MIFSWETSKHPKSNQEPSKMSKIKSRKPNRNSMMMIAMPPMMKMRESK